MHVHDWPSSVLDKTQRILSSASSKKSSWTRFIDVSLYWVLLFLAVLGNLIISVVFVPILVVLSGFGLFFVLFVSGISFGWLFSFILHNLEDLHDKHVVASIFIPAVALINVYIFTVLSNKLIVLMSLPTPEHSPFLVGLVYVIGYVLPGVVSHLRK